ncbi:MAG: oligosaccharide flippase family protein [Ancalomicrobiaceae bacterium]|nr:oligosaccharide flippase family protein [Ancalomicrobiaceae bacterium]
MNIWPARIAARAAAAPEPKRLARSAVSEAAESADTDAPDGGRTANADARPSGHEHRRLAVNAVAGGLANVLKIGVQLIMLPLMAHLLGPAEFGLYALALPTVSFFMILADGGLTASLAREPRESTLVWSTAFWLVLPVGLALAAIVSTWGLALAQLAREPRVSGLMALLSISLVMIAASALPSANLIRQGRLVVFAAADLSSTVIGASVAVALAASGLGADSLAAQYVTYYTFRAVFLNGAGFVRPALQFKLSALADHFSTGSALLGVKLADFSGRLIENLLYGRAFGAAGLGLYTFANQAPRFISEAASGPVWAALYAHALREDERRVTATHANLVRLLASLVFPVAALLSATAPEILGVILGPKWDAASTLLRILIPFYALQVVASQSGAVLLARGRGWLLFWLSLVLTCGRVGAVAIGPWIGQVGVACGIGAVLTVFAMLMFRAPRRSNAPRLERGIVAPAVAGLAAGVVCYELARQHGGLGWIAVCWATGALAYIGVLVLLQGKTVLNDLQAIRRLAFRRQRADLA